MPLHPLLTEWDASLYARDPLGFPGYVPPSEGESVRTGIATVDGAAPAYALIEGRFEVMGGSMGAAAGERVVRAYRRAAEARLPVVVVAASGGARMQEGMVALAQLPRTAAAASAHARAGLLSVAVFRPPTTGGVLVSYAAAAAVRGAEPGATIGFAGPRVVEITTGHAPSDASHTAESAFAAGLVDALVARDDQARWVETVLGYRARRLDVAPRAPQGGRAPSDAAATGTGTTAWTEVLRARAPDRPTGVDVAASLCESWVELRGPDPTLRAALAAVGGKRAVVMATDRFAVSPLGALGRPGPAAFRLAQRAIALAARLGLPLVSLVDTPGADPSEEAERGGIAHEISATFTAMAALPSTSVAVCVGEGGSGGALALACADRLLVQEHAVFSVIAPEAAAVILRRDASEVPHLAAELGLAAGDLLRLGVVDEVVPESEGALAAAVANALQSARPGDRERRFDAATERWLT